MQKAEGKSSPTKLGRELTRPRSSVTATLRVVTKAIFLSNSWVSTCMFPARDHVSNWRAYVTSLGFSFKAIVTLFIVSLDLIRKFWVVPLSKNFRVFHSSLLQLSVAWTRPSKVSTAFNLTSLIILHILLSWHIYCNKGKSLLCYIVSSFD